MAAKKTEEAQVINDVSKENITEQNVSADNTVTLTAEQYNGIMSRINVLEAQANLHERALAGQPVMRARAKAEEKKVMLRIPPGRTDYERQPLFIAANGRCMKVPRGVQVEVPESIANAYYDSEMQTLAAANAIDKMSAKINDF